MPLTRKPAKEEARPAVTGDLRPEEAAEGTDLAKEELWTDQEDLTWVGLQM